MTASIDLTRFRRLNDLDIIPCDLLVMPILGEECVALFVFKEQVLHQQFRLGGVFETFELKLYHFLIDGSIAVFAGDFLGARVRGIYDA
jgi:hypothetical protein